MQILRKTNLDAYKKAVKLRQKGTIRLITEKGLTGRGGARFPTGKKWEIAANSKEKEKYVICNADEGEPGTFKDRFILMNNPELVIEGILIATYAVNAKQAYIYLRGEYEYLTKNLEKVIKKIKTKEKSK